MKEHDMDVVFKDFKGKEKRGMCISLSFIDKNDKTLHYARLIEIGDDDLRREDLKFLEPEMVMETIIAHYTEAMKLTYRSKVKDKLKKEFDFF